MGRLGERSIAAERRTPGWVARALVAGIALSGLGSVAGCVGATSGSGACTLVGCDDAVWFEFPPELLAGDGAELVACVDGDCRTWEGPSDASPQLVQLFSVPVRADAGRSVAIEASSTVDGRSVALDVVDRVRLETSYPNGRSCPPTCRSASVTLGLAD